MITIKHLLFIFATFTIFSASSEARLGETKPEIEKRFGEPIDRPESFCLGRLKSISSLYLSHLPSRMEYRDYANKFASISVIYIDGKSVYEQYICYSKITKEELIQLLNVNALGKEWQGVQNWGVAHYEQKKWVLIETHDLNQKKEYATAIFDGSQTLELTMQALNDYIKELQDATAKQEADRKAKALKDF